MSRRNSDNEVCENCWRPTHKGKCESMQEYQARIRAEDLARIVARAKREAE
jgi:hypothetical protein